MSSSLRELRADDAIDRVTLMAVRSDTWDKPL